MVFEWRGRRYRVTPVAIRRVVALLLVGALLSFVGVFLKALRIHQEVRTLEAALEAQRQANAAMEKALQEASTPEAVESRARATLGLVKPGEEVVEPALPVSPDDPYRVPRR